MADRSAGDAVTADAYLRTPAAAARTRWRQTIEVPPCAAARRGRGTTGTFFDPYAFVANPTPRAGPLFYRRSVELVICPLEPASACGQDPGLLSGPGDIEAESTG